MSTLTGPELPKLVPRAVGIGFILFALLVAWIALQCLLGLRQPSGWQPAAAAGALASIMGFTGVVLFLQDKTPGAMRRLFFLCFGSAGVLLGCGQFVAIGYSLFVEHQVRGSLRLMLFGPPATVLVGILLLRQGLKNRGTAEPADNPRIERLPDCIWMTREAKLGGIASEIRQRSDAASAIVLVAHFPNVLADLADVAASTQVAIPIVTSLAKSLTISVLPNIPGASDTICLIAGEHHPLPERDRWLTEFASDLACRAQIVFHLSLEDDLLKFVAPGVAQTLRQLGMKENDRIESRMVSRQLAGVQKKLAGRGIGDSKAESAAEWLQQNLSGLRRS